MYDQYYEEMMRRMRVPQVPQTPGNPMPPLKGAGNMPTTAALPYPDTGPMNPPPMTPPMEGPSMPQLPPQGSPKAAAIRGAPLEEIQVQGQRVTPSSGMVAGMEGQQGMPQGPTPEMIAKMSQGIEAEQAGIDRQRKVADQMRGRRAPQGREVGPIGVYMGPNWGESLGYAAEQIGAGLVDRSASKKDAGLQKKRDEIRTAEAEYAESLRKQGLEREDKEIARQQANADRTFNQNAAQAAARLEAEAEMNALDHEQALELERLKQDAKPKVPPGATKEDKKTINASSGRIENLRKTRSQYDMGLEALEEGARTGPIWSKLWTISDSSKKLEAAADQIAMDKIGEQTFGSLSEAEAEWLRRVAIPTTLQEDEVEEHIRKEQARIDALIAAEEYKIAQTQAGEPIDQEVIDGYREQFLAGFEPPDEEEDERTVVRTGTDRRGRKVIMYSDGTQEVR